MIGNIEDENKSVHSHEKPNNLVKDILSVQELELKQENMFMVLKYFKESSIFKLRWNYFIIAVKTTKETK